MGTKRGFDELESLNPAPAPRFAKKPKKFTKGRHKAKEGTSEHAKKRTRAIQRLMQRSQGDLPANVRNDLERELDAHKGTVADRAFQKRRTKMISKYHMVRFFERKKAMRLIKQLKRKIEQADDEAEKSDLQQQLHAAEVDEAYTLYHPHAETYISLYGNSKQEHSDNEDGNGQEQKGLSDKLGNKSEKPAMWKTVEKTMQEGTEALQRLRERRSAEEGEEEEEAFGRRQKQPSKTPSKAPSGRPNAEPSLSRNDRAGQPDKGRSGQKPVPEHKAGLNRRERRKLMHEALATREEEEEDSDGGGFFEGM